MIIRLRGVITWENGNEMSTVVYDEEVSRTSNWENTYLNVDYGFTVQHPWNGHRSLLMNTYSINPGSGPTTQSEPTWSSTTIP